jgi:arsenite methyltransferase
LGEVPSIKELLTKYQAQGLTVIGISLDEDAQALQNAVASKAIPWPQIRDGKDGPLAKLFNIAGTPSYYVIDRAGKIAAKAGSVKKLGELIPGLLKTSNAAAAIEAEPRDKEQKPVEVLQLMGVRAGQVIADIGAGDGYFTRRFAAAIGPTGKALGIEIDPKAVRAMTVDAQRRGLSNYEARLVPPDDPLLAPQSVDIIFLSDAFHHIENRTAYFNKVRAALKPNGRLVIIDFGGSGQHAISKEETLKTLQQAGYKLVKEHDLLLPRQFFFEFALAQ